MELRPATTKVTYLTDIALRRLGPEELDLWEARSQRFNFAVEGADRDQVLNEAKGVILHAVGDWPHVPDCVRFEVVEEL